MIVRLYRALAVIARLRAEIRAWRALGRELVACRDVEGLLELQERVRARLGERAP